MNRQTELLRRACVVIADDDRSFRSAIADALRAVGVRDIVLAADGAEALQHARGRTPDVMIVGLDLPRDGLLTLDQIRVSKDVRIQNLAVIMVTALATKAHVELLRDSGATEVLLKPVAADTLVGRFQAALVNPRPFIAGGSYRGPDRRRSSGLDYRGPYRRSRDLPVFDIDVA
jgi:DNA-binding response OmpR family regulator